MDRNRTALPTKPDHLRELTLAEIQIQMSLRNRDRLQAEEARLQEELYQASATMPKLPPTHLTSLRRLPPLH